jgi:hypothetical protein
VRNYERYKIHWQPSHVQQLLSPTTKGKFLSSLSKMLRKQRLRCEDDGMRRLPTMGALKMRGPHRGAVQPAERSARAHRVHLQKMFAVQCGRECLEGLGRVRIQNEFVERDKAFEQKSTRLCAVEAESAKEELALRLHKNKTPVPDELQFAV